MKETFILLTVLFFSSVSNANLFEDTENTRCLEESSSSSTIRIVETKCYHQNSTMNIKIVITPKSNKHGVEFDYATVLVGNQVTEVALEKDVENTVLQELDAPNDLQFRVDLNYSYPTIKEESNDETLKPTHIEI